MNRQEVFDISGLHMMKQFAKSEIAVNPECTWMSCRYRSPEGLKCGIGALICDDAYHEKLEGKSAVGGHVKHALLASGYAVHDKDDHFLIEEIQRIHDSRPVGDWIYQLQRVAEKLNLDSTKVTIAAAEYGRIPNDM